MDLGAALESRRYTKAMMMDAPDPRVEFPKISDDELNAFEAKLQEQGTRGRRVPRPNPPTPDPRETPQELATPAKYVMDMATYATKAYQPKVAKMREADIRAKFVDADPQKQATNFPFGADALLRCPAPAVDAATYAKHVAPPPRTARRRPGPSDLKGLAAREPSFGADVERVVFAYLEQAALEAFKKSGRYRTYLRFLRIQQNKPKLDDFNPFRVLGRGGFGKVNACRTYTTGRMYAMKSCIKKHVKKGNAFQLCANEHAALKALDSPFTVNLKYAFATKEELVLIMDLCMGGDLRYWLKAEGKFADERTKYYAARTILALRDIHAIDLVYRDLKPENVLAVPYKEGMKGCSGTSGYIPPEAVAGDVYDKTADFFALGCLVYECFNGRSPYRTEAAHDWLVNEFKKPEPEDSGDKKKKKKPQPGDLDDKDKIPFVPPANGQHVPDEIDIGEFPDLGKKVKLEPGDFDEDAWTFVSPKAFGTEIVWFLKWKEKKDATPQPPPLA
ncbi:G-protein coupled receptor kinase [Aureococcus anophagefferens]|nr:G-protein coupled receptor kinase [Aureococcus anophagefferens]